jgi:hypothetical protein
VVLAEESGIEGARAEELEVGADAVHTHLGDGDGEAAIAQIVARLEDAPERTSVRTRSCSARSAARSTAGGRPRSIP